MKRTGMKRASNPPAWLDEGRALQAEGLSYREIGQRVGASRSQAHYWLARKGMSRAVRECPTCDEEFRPYDLRQKFCSRKCARAKEVPAEQRERQATLMRGRTGDKNPNFKSGRRVGVRDRAGEKRWYAAAGDLCQAPECPGGHAVSLHHVCYAQHVVSAGGDKWDPANSLNLCFSCHGSHHARGRVLPLSCLRDENYAYAFDLMGPAAYDYLRRYYDGEDPRLDALLAHPVSEAA